MKRIINLVVLVCIPISVISQTYDTKYSEDIEEINEYLLANEFSDALPILQKLEKKGYENANISYKLGQCYLNSVHNKTKAISYLEKASKSIIPNYSIENTLEKNAPYKAILYLGDAYRVNNRLTEAVRSYKKYLSLVKNDNQEKAVAEKRIFESQLAQVFMKKPVNVWFDKLNPAINEGMGNFNACISGDGKSLVFNRKMKFYDAIFFCTWTDNDWSEPKEITTHVGSDGEFQPTGLSPDGKRMLLKSYNHLSGYDIYESVFRDGKWRKIKLLGNSVNSPFHELDAIYGADGKSIYFSSNRTTGFGGFDFYKASVDEAGNVGTAENMGNTINSEWDEKSPSFLDNGKVLVFSSQRKPGIGGYDFFYSKLDADGKWGTVYNAGYPLSTVDDDLGFSTRLQSNEGVLAKHEQQSTSDADIFNVKFDVLSKFKLVPLRGEVQLKSNDELSYKGLNLYFIDETIKDTVGTIESPEGGKYKIDLYSGDFKLVMSREKSESVTQAFMVSSDESKPDYQLISEFKPQTEVPSSSSTSTALKIKADTIYVTDILFEFDRASISLSEKDKVENLIHKLKNHKIDRIELIGFTDCFGNKVYNNKLSAQRASNILNLFIESGISKSILTSKGMGDSVAAAKNKNEDGSDNPRGRAYNRRVEIHINSSESNLIIIKKDIVPVHLKP